MPAKTIRKRRPDKRKTYWSFITVHLWRRFRNLEKVQRLDLRDRSEDASWIPNWRELADLTRVLSQGEQHLTVEDRIFSAISLSNTKVKVETALNSGQLPVHKHGLRATDVVKLWPGKKKAGVGRSAQRTDLALQVAKIMLSESRIEHRAVDRKKSDDPHMDDLRRGKKPAFMAEVVKDAKAIVESDIELRESLAEIATTMDSTVAGRIERGRVKFLSKITPALEIKALQSELDTARRGVPSWSQRGRIKVPLK